MKKGSFQVKGLSFDDLTVLVANFFPDLNKLTEIISAVREQNGATALLTETFVMKVAVQAPTLVAHTIMLGAAPFDPDVTELKVRGLPFPVQFMAVKDILDLTFEEVGGPKEFAGLVVKIAKAMQTEIGAMETMN